MTEEVVTPEHLEEAHNESEEPHNKLEEAHKKSNTYIYTAMGFGLIPVPVVDFAAISLTQLKMVHSLAKHYDIPFSKNIGKSVIGSLVGGVLPAPIGMAFASMMKAIPVVGTLVGATSVSLFAGASTYALSRVFIQHFEAGGTFLNFDPEAVREYFKEEFNKGKVVVEDIKKTKAKTK
jgi:uncharacterized protein (DUF697 family)